MKNMYKIVFAVVITFFVMSCNNRDDENYIQNVDKIKIDSVKIAQDTMDVNTIQTIKTYSTYSNGCHRFYDYDYVAQDFTRAVTAYSYTANETCTQATYSGTSQFNFRPVQKGVYLFKFYNGNNAAGTAQFIEKNIVVE